MTVRYVARGWDSFDVYAGPTLVGSVWKYRMGWAVFDPEYRMMSGFFPDRATATTALVEAAK